MKRLVIEEVCVSQKKYRSSTDVWRELPVDVIGVIMVFYCTLLKLRPVEMYIKMRYILYWLNKEDVITMISRCTILNLKKPEDIYHMKLNKVLIELNVEFEGEVDKIPRLLEDGDIEYYNLHSLTLSGKNNISDKSIMKMTGLTQLNLRYNNRVSIEAIKGLDNLKDLTLYKCWISDDSLGSMTQLMHLNYNPRHSGSYNSINRLTNLQTLVLDGYTNNNIGVHNMTNLMELSLERSDVEGKSIMVLSRLVKLHYGHNTKINDLAIKKLTNLTDLSIPHNKGIKGVGLKSLMQLRRLAIGHNSLIRSDSIYKLTNLTELDLDHNEVITNEGLEKLKNLTSLNLRNNTEITGHCISYLINLRHLNLCQCRYIKDDGIQCLSNLEYLNLIKNNEITENVLVRLTKLKTLVIDEQQLIIQPYNNPGLSIKRVTI